MWHTAATVLSVALVPCPPTRWCVPRTLASLEQARDHKRATPFLAPVELPDDVHDAIDWVQQHADVLMQKLDDSGALHFRGFATPRSRAGLREFCDALPLTPCEDPLASIGVRKLLSSQAGVYEAVNSPALSRTFIGLHNDATFKLTAPYAAFACLQQAESGGEFLLADGRAVLAELLSGHTDEALAPLFERNVSVRVAALDLDPLFAIVPEALHRPIRVLLRQLVGFALGLAVPLDLQLAWGYPDAGTQTATRRTSVLQILEQPKAPVNRHPHSGQPSFFSSLHSQARHLQKRRAAIFSQTSVSAIATTDVFFGDDLQPIDPALLDVVDEVVSRLTRRIAMQPGDLVLLDTYQVLHGRDVFEGPREHAVVWLAEPMDRRDRDGLESA